ncbi:MAG: hypothetical protein EAZ81_00490 [Verrucomicrobia bacterium]|nr:MAG: hypothetical protein EAZ81_00490 [Verrucomicrobiota bacterium]
MEFSQPITTDQQEGAKSPLFPYREIILALLASFYGGGGFGDKFFTETSFLAVSLIIMVTSKKWMILIICTIIITTLFQPALIQSPLLLAGILFSAKKPIHGVIVLLGSAMQHIGAFNPYYIPLILILVSAFMLWRPFDSEKLAFKGITSALLAINILSAFLVTKSPEAHQGFDFPYRVDIAKMTGVQAPGNTYSSIDDQGDLSGSEILVLEHDPKHGLAEFNWSQQRLWTNNQYFGSPLLRIATSLDGYLYSNLGCRVQNSGIRLLGEAHRTEYNSYISKKSGKLIFSDSDFLNNGAIGYQPHLIQATFHKFSHAHFILYGTSLGFIFALWLKSKQTAITIMAAVSVTACIGLHYQKIDIRIVDRNAPWPHSNGIGGIAANVSEEEGIMKVGRTGRAKILGIARDCSATHQNEKVIVMEGGSTVTIGNSIYEALDLPKGIENGINDAIPVRKKGTTEIGSCIQQVGDILLIGTNSAKSNWKKIYDASK